MTDPAVIVEESIQRMLHGPDDLIARTVLADLHADGWRLVKVAATDTEFDDDPDSPTYEQQVPVWTIAEQWAP